MAAIPVCVKTPKGIEEVEKRTHRLPMRARQLLIMVDGKRDYDTLLTMFPGDATSSLCQQLLAEGFITPLVKAEPAPPPPPQPPAPAPVAPPPAAPSGPLSAVDEQRLKMARSFMMNTLGTFVGHAASSLITRIEDAGALEHLHALAPEWRKAIALSGDGRKQLADLESRLAVTDERFLAALAAPAAPVAAPAAAAPAPAATAPVAPAPADDAERLTMARNFMMNTLNAFVGMAASSLITRIEGAPNLDELRHFYGDWRDSMSLSGDGRKRLPELETKLAALLS